MTWRGYTLYTIQAKMHSDQSWYVPLQCTLAIQQWPNFQCYRSRWVGGAFGLKPDLPPCCSAVASAYQWLSKVKWGEYFQHTWKCLHTTQSPRWNEVSHWTCSAHLEMSSMCIKAQDALGSTREAQRCKKRQIWQIISLQFFQGDAKFFLHFTWIGMRTGSTGLCY